MELPLSIPNIPLGFKCTKCGCPLHSFGYFELLNYFGGKNLQCTQCKSQSKLFDVLSDCIEENFFFNDVFSFIGAQKTLFNFSLEPDNPITLKFSNYGVPSDARILHINYTPSDGGLFPIEMHGNSPYRGMPKGEVTLYPSSFPHREKNTTNINVMLTWVHGHSSSDISLKVLIDALEEYAHNDLESCIVPANTAIEFEVMRYIEQELEKICSKSDIKSLFSSGTTYIPSLKVLLPLIATLKKVPILPNEVMSGLKALASLRNQIAHTGKTKSPLNKKQIAKSLASVIIARHYIKFIQRA